MSFVSCTEFAQASLETCYKMFCFLVICRNQAKVEICWIFVLFSSFIRLLSVGTAAHIDICII